MNQILSIDNSGEKNIKAKNKKAKKSGNKGPIEISSIVKFFSISICLFGIFMIGVALYGIYKQSNTEVSNTKPTILVEEISENQINLKISHDKAMSKLVYSWNDEEQIEVQANGRRNIEQLVVIPTGTNELEVIAIDMNGQETRYKRTYTVQGDIEISLSVDGNNIKITAEGKNELSYLTYRWGDSEETRVDINDMTVEERIETLEGSNILTVIVVDINNTVETKEQEVIGTTKPKVEIGTDGANNFIIIASDEQGLKRIEFLINEGDEDEDKNFMNLDGQKEIEYPYPFKEGENRLEVRVYNQNDVVEIKRVKVDR